MAASAVTSGGPTRTMKFFKNEHPFTTAKDISSVAFWNRPFIERDETFAWLRENEPVSWHPAIEDPNLPPEMHGEAGFWAVTRAEDIRFVSQHNQLFSSQIGTVQIWPKHPEMSYPPTFLELDPPLHTRYRKIMSCREIGRASCRERV